MALFRCREGARALGMASLSDPTQSTAAYGALPGSRDAAGVLGIDENGDGKTVMLSDEQDLMVLLKPSSIDRSRVLNRGGAIHHDERISFELLTLKCASDTRVPSGVGYRMIVTGTGDRRVTVSATLPNSTRPTPDRP
jgi:hypothetical protein